MHDLKPTEATLYGRLSYCNIWEAVKSKVPGMENKDPQFSGTLLISKKDVNQVAAFKKAEEAAIEIGVAKKSKGRRPNKITRALQDGDAPTPKKGDPQPPEYAGHWYIHAINSQDSPPQIVDLDGNPLTVRRDVYSGCWVRFGVNLAYYDHPTGGAGISVYLGAVQKIKDDQPFASTGITAARAFAAPIDPALLEAYGDEAGTAKQKPAFMGGGSKPAAQQPAAPAGNTRKALPDFMKAKATGQPMQPAAPAPKAKPAWMK